MLYVMHALAQPQRLWTILQALLGEPWTLTRTACARLSVHA